ncbi:hypothetical protein FNV43_RR08280 [Rhamnella rubrinervis]|uniref:DNA-directed RNA polymerase subunit n=1 Tax=Rhamnella rubrinervis TaxID=2594499 RepID=A0A8K0MN45_9ROSA|nr:hypothetical protein FNV43_RR08280 [Rhamnella rubrinervis]
MKKKNRNFVNNAELNLLILGYEDIKWDTSNWHAQSNMKLRILGVFNTPSIPLFFTNQGFEIFRNREISTGASAIREQLADLDLQILIDFSLVEWKELGEEGLTGNEWEDRKVGRRKDFLVRRMELAKHFIRTNIEPEWMVLCLLPVLPPELRPIIQIDGGKLMSSDINELYRRVIYRNNTLIDLLTTSRSTPGEFVMCQEKLVQEAVDTLLDNGIRGQPMRDGHNKVYKSFSDVIEGKEGRFRETLLGKRVDYSGRSVIVVGPSLSLHRCGLPREIAIELFQTFVICGLIRQHFASNIGVAKSKIREKEPVVWERLQEVMQGHPVLLNRAPTLHRLGIQAFQPILVEGHAICLHPLVCKGFNADFDGDQMAVHVPFSLEAQAEARLLMFSHTNLLSPAIGDPISVPTQDMLIGLYVLTSGNRRARKGVVDTAVRTSDAGYLTRRLVEVVQHIVVRRTDCGTIQGISHVLDLPIMLWPEPDSWRPGRIGRVGILAGQSIGEPGTQLTLRTFHTGGVFTGGTAEHVRAPSNGKIKFNEDLVHPTQNSDFFLLAKRRRNRFIIPFQWIQKRETELMPHSSISIELPINGLFRRKSLLAYFDDPQYRRKSSGITKYGSLAALSRIS